MNTEFASIQEIRAISFELLRLTMTQPQDDAQRIYDGRYLCFAEELPPVVEQRFIVPPLDQAVEVADATEVRLHLLRANQIKDVAASIALQRCMVGQFASALLGVQYDVLTKTEYEGPRLRVSSSLGIFPSGESLNMLGMSAEVTRHIGFESDWAAGDLSSPEAQLYFAFQAARDAQKDSLSHEGLDETERKKLEKSFASSPEAQFLVELIQQAPHL